jgi:hypothetical protein
MNIFGILLILILSPYAFLNSMMQTIPEPVTPPTYLEGKPCVDDSIQCQLLKPTPSNMENSNFRTVLKTQNYNMPSRTNIVIKTPTELKEIEDSVNSFKTPDFAKNMLIAVFMGDKSSGGYSVEIERITEEDSKINVFITETSPGTGCMTTMALTSPAQIVEYKLSAKPVTFITKKVTSECK